MKKLDDRTLKKLDDTPLKDVKEKLVDNSSMLPLEIDEKNVKKEKKRNETLSSKQTIIQTSNTISTNKSWE